MLDSLMAAGVPFRFAEDMRSISMDHDGTPPEGGPLDCRDIPDMVPILSVLASRASGKSALGHVAHVRLKESDRVASMLQLRKMGAKVEFDGNDMTFEGVQRLHGAKLSSFNDHRVLMALTVAGSIATGVTELSYPHAYRISYPEFLDHMNALGDSRRGLRPRPVRRRTGVVGRPEMILDDLDRHARERPGERAVVEISADGTVRELSWGALRNESDRVASALLRLGVLEGEPVAFQLPNRLEFVTIALGTLRAGAVCEPLMPIFRERELAFMLRESGARVLFVPDQFRGRDHAAMAAGLRAELPALEHVVVVDGDVAGRPTPRWPRPSLAPTRSRSCCSPRGPRASPRARSTATTC